MKKTLYGTTAIVAMGLAIVAAAPASAQAPAQGFSSTNFQFTVGGLGRGFVGGASQSDVQSGARQRFDIQKDWRLDFTGRATLSNGLTVGATAQITQPGEHGFQAAATTALATATSVTNFRADPWLRRNWVFVQSNFGLLQIGAVDNAAFQMHQADMDAFTAGSVRTGKIYDFLTYTTSPGRDDSAFGATNLRVFDRSSEKIAYFTPRIEGFQLGLNYTPEASMDRNSSVPVSSGGGYQRGYAAGLNYINTFSGVGVRASAGYLTWETPNNVATAVAATKKNPTAYSAGLGFTYMGFDIGGSWAQTDNLLNLGRGTYSNTPAQGNQATNVLTLDGSAYSAGLGYTTGPVRVSLNWFSGKTDSRNYNIATGVTANQTGQRGDDKLQGIALNGAYTMGPGVTVEASLFNIRHTSAVTSTNVTTDQKATGLITGLILAF